MSSTWSFVKGVGFGLAIFVSMCYGFGMGKDCAYKQMEDEDDNEQTTEHEMDNPTEEEDA